MDSIGDFLYLLLMVGAVIISIIKKSKDKQVAPPPPKPPQRDFKDLFPEMGNWMDDEEEEQPVQPAPRTEVFPSAQSPTRAQPIETPVFTYDAPEIAKPGRAVAKNAVVELQEEEEGGGVFDEERFDLRKAVVYSEIMKRPTW